MSAGGPAYEKSLTEDPNVGALALLLQIRQTFFRTKSVEEALADREDDEKSLKKCLTLLELVLLG